MADLIKKGGKVDAQDALGNTPLHYAAASRNLPALEVLLKNVRDRLITNDI